MREESKIHIYKTYIRPVLTYANETRSETSKTKRMMRILNSRNENIENHQRGYT